MLSTTVLQDHVAFQVVAVPSEPSRFFINNKPSGILVIHSPFRFPFAFSPPQGLTTLQNKNVGDRSGMQKEPSRCPTESQFREAGFSCTD